MVRGHVTCVQPSTELWSWLYVALIGALIFAVRRNRVCLDCAIVLLFWQLLAKAVYVCGEIEFSGRIATALVVISLFVAMYVVHKDWLPGVLAAVGGGVLLWTLGTLVWDIGAYNFKAGWNAAYLLGASACLGRLMQR